MQKPFKTRELLDMGLPSDPPEGGRIISDVLSEHDRWSVVHTLIVQFPEQMGTDDAWELSYGVGATESQNESPWEYEDEVTGTLVRRTTKVVDVWESLAEAEKE